MTEVKVDKWKATLKGEELELSRTLYKCEECNEWYGWVGCSLIFQPDKETEVYCPKSHYLGTFEELKELENGNT